MNVSFSVGKGVENVRGLKQLTVPFATFAEAVLKKSGTVKDGLYVCGPMQDSYRKAVNALPISYLALDFDHLTQQQWAQVASRSQKWASFCYTTPSHSPASGDHRLRVFVHLSRPVNRDEYRTLYAMVAAELGVPGDMSGAKPEQAMYTRRDNTVAKKNLDKSPLNVDTLLASNPVEADALGPIPAWLQGKAVSSLPQEKVEHAPFWAADVANHCAQVRHVRDTQGHGSLDHWRNVVGLIKIGQDGIELAREWTAKRLEAHDQADVDREWRTWKGTGPPLCETFERVNPAGCEGCPHKGKIKTPATLGRREPVATPVELVEALVNGQAVKVQVPELPPSYFWNGQVLQRFMKDKDGVMVPHDITTSRFYPINYIAQIGGTGAMTMRQHVPDGRTKDFHFESKNIPSPADLQRALAEQNIMTINEKAGNHLTAYMKASLNKLMRESKEIAQAGAFGWRDDMKSFLIGDRLYTADGGMTIALVGGAAANYKSAFTAPKPGMAQQWAQAIDLLYNREGMQHMQYAVCSAFGSLLSPFAESLYKGIPCAVTGEDSGKGKSAVCKAAMYAFGDAERMTLNGARGTTGNALYMQMGAYNNLPLLWDEITNTKPEVLSDMLYTLSGGRDKGRLMAGKTTGVKAQDIGEWRMSPYLTANKKLSASLASKQGNTEAEAVRLFEISIDVYGVQMADLADAEAAFVKIERGQGGAGEVYIKHLVQNLAAVESAYLHMSKKVGDAASLAKVSQYRFFRQHVICTLTAANILHGLGLVGFDMNALYGWAMKHLHTLCLDVQANNVTATTDALGQMLVALSPFIIQTKELRDARTNKFGPEEINKPNGPVVGREVRSTGKLYISQAAAKKWCGESRQNIDRIIDQATKDRSFCGEIKQFCLTRGTNLTAGRIPVYEFNVSILGQDDE